VRTPPDVVQAGLRVAVIAAIEDRVAVVGLAAAAAAAAPRL